MWSTWAVEKEEGFIKILELCRLDSEAVITLGKKQEYDVKFLIFLLQKRENLQFKKSPVRRELYRELMAGEYSTLRDK